MPADMPKMLHVGRAGDVATSPQRLAAFRQLGFEVSPLDLSRYVETGGRLAIHLRLKTGMGPGVRPLNREFVRLAEKVRPQVIWVDKGLYLWPESITAAREASGGALMVHLNPDDPFGGCKLGWRIFLKAIPAYDVHAVARDVNLAEYQAAGAKHVIRYHWGYDPTLHRPMPVTPADRERLGGKVGFIGDWEEERAESIQYLAEHGVPVRVWGPRWERKLRRPHPLVRVEGACVTGDDYARAISAFDVNLGFVRKINRDQSTTRSVEIPACGGFLLAERTAEHRIMFEEGLEAEFFGTDAELLEKCRVAMQDDARRRAVAEAGRLRCAGSGYAHVHRQRALLQTIRADLGDRFAWLGGVLKSAGEPPR